MERPDVAEDLDLMYVMYVSMLSSFKDGSFYFYFIFFNFFLNKGTTLNDITFPNIEKLNKNNITKEIVKSHNWYKFFLWLGFKIIFWTNIWIHIWTYIGIIPKNKRKYLSLFWNCMRNFLRFFFFTFFPLLYAFQHKIV